MTEQRADPPAELPFRDRGRLAGALIRWETLLLFVGVALFIFNALATPYFLNPWTLSDATFNFTEKAIIALAVALLVISGEIDLSVASIVALASIAMGAVAEIGGPLPVIVATGLAVGVLAGAVNGFIVTAFALPSIVVTIGTLSLYRGIGYIVLGDGVFKNYPPEFAIFGQSYVWWVISFELASFLVLAVLFAILLHKTAFGRSIYAIGNNTLAARFAGIRVERVKFLLFCLSGLMAGVASVMLTSRLGSTRPTIAFGWELEIVTMVVLGGVSILGGSGSIPGVVIAAFVMGLITFGLGLLNVPGVVMSIAIGSVLIFVIALPRILAMVRR